MRRTLKDLPEHVLRMQRRGIPLLLLGSLTVAMCLAPLAIHPIAARTSARAEGKRLLARSASLAPDTWSAAARPQSYRGRLEPWRVGIQVGHWRIDQLPPALFRLLGSTGARYREFREVDLNLEIATDIARILRQAGIRVDLLPATVPPGYDADAFVAVHADGTDRPGTRGWKASTAWRASEASRRLLAAISLSYARHTGLPEDRYGVTFNMRGYYAMSAQRIRYAVAPTTPSVIVEAGFVTAKEDRDALFGHPEVAALGIAEGIILFLSQHDPMDERLLAPQSYPAVQVTADTASLYSHPDDSGKLTGTVAAGTLVTPLQRIPGWVEVVVRGNYRMFGWLRDSSVEFPGTSAP